MNKHAESIEECKEEKGNQSQQWQINGVTMVACCFRQSPGRTDACFNSTCERERHVPRRPFARGKALGGRNPHTVILTAAPADELVASPRGSVNWVGVSRKGVGLCATQRLRAPSRFLRSTGCDIPAAEGGLQAGGPGLGVAASTVPTCRQGNYIPRPPPLERSWEGKAAYAFCLSSAARRSPGGRWKPSHFNLGPQSNHLS